MTISGLKLKNFQAHRDLALTFDPNVNVIVGPTNVGKSSIFRAVKWLVQHKPISGLQTFDTDDTRVGIKSDNGTVIRFKNGDGYGYSVNGDKFVACGNTQPQEVQRLLGLSEVNLQGQHDPPFLLTLTPGQMAKELNRIVDLSVIDKAVSISTKALSDAKSKAEAAEQMVAHHQAEADKLQWVQVAVTEFEKLSEIESELQTKQTKQTELLRAIDQLNDNIASAAEVDSLILELSALVQDIQKFEDTRKSAHATLQISNGLVDVLSNLSSVNACGKQLKALVDLSEALAKAKASQNAIQAVVQQYDRLAGLDASWTELDSLIQDATNISIADTKLTGLSILLDSHAGCLNSIAVQQTLIDKLEKEKPVCPTCKRPL